MNIARYILAGVFTAWTALAQPAAATAEEYLHKEKVESSEVIAPERKKIPIRLGLQTEVLTRDVFGGMPYSEGHITQGILSGSYCLRKSVISLIGLVKYDLEDKQLDSLYGTVDYTLLLSDKASLSFGLIKYTFPNTDMPETEEIYGSLGISKPVNLCVTAWHDIDEDRGTYGELTVGKCFKLKNGVSVLPELSLGYNDDYYRDGKGLSHVRGGLKLPVTINPSITIVPHINYSKALDDDFRNFLYGGIRLEYRK